MKERIDSLDKKLWFRILLLFIGYIVLPPLFLLFAIPIWTYRRFIIWVARVFKRNELGLPLSPESGLTTPDDYYGRPKHVVVGMHYTDIQISREVVEKRMSQIISTGRYPELRQKLIRYWGILFWGKCDTFNLSNHILEHKDAKTLSDIQLYEDYLVEKGFLRNQPLWDITLFPNYKDGEGGSAFCLRVHHCLTDGVGHVNLLNTIESGKPPPPLPKETWGETIANNMSHLTHLIKIYLKYQYPICLAFLCDYNFNPWIKPEKEHAKKRNFYETYELDVQVVKKAANVTGFTVSEVLIASFATGIRKDMEEHGEQVPYTMSAIHPLPKPGHPGTLTNHTYLNSILIPVGVRDRFKQLEMVACDYKLKKTCIPLANLSVQMFGVFLQLANFLPPAGPYCSLAVTNFALSSKPWRLFGAEIKRTSFAFDVSEHVPMVAMFIGYNGKMVLWVKGRADVTSQSRTKDIITTMTNEIKDMATSS